MRVALLDGERAEALAVALVQDGAESIAARRAPRLEGLLAKRGFTPGLSALPAGVTALRRGGYDVAHAFSPPAALAALAWRRRGGGAVVFTCTEVLDRGNVADRRLRLHALASALEQSDAVTASSDEVRSSLDRWMACEAPVLDAPAVRALYRELAAGVRVARRA